MSILEELEDLAGPTRSSVLIKRNRKNKNRVVDGVAERICNRCNTWKPLSEYQQIKRVFQTGQVKMVYHCACKPCAYKWIYNAKVKRELMTE